MLLRRQTIAGERSAAMNTVTQRLAEAICAAVASEADLRVFARSVADTIAVAAAGAATPVVKHMRQASAGSGPVDWFGYRHDSIESAVMLNATAAHALDFDDVLLDSHLHPSTVVLAPILALAGDEETAANAFVAGLIAARVVAAQLGPGHYDRGWHGTGTIGAFAAAAAAARALKLDAAQAQSTLALAAAMSGGLQVNFGTMAKPAQAGFAAVAGLRAARLAQAGVTGVDDVLGPGGYPALYGDASTGTEFGSTGGELGGIAIKLYPSCFAAARLIGVALDARCRGVAELSDPTLRIRVTAPAGSLAALRYDAPKTGAQAQFSARYNVARALLDGRPTMAHFSDEAIHDPAVRDAMARIVVVEDGSERRGDIRRGRVTLEILREHQTIATFERRAIPGTPDDPPSEDALRAKWADCLATYRLASGSPFDVAATLGSIPHARALLTPAIP